MGGCSSTYMEIWAANHMVHRGLTQSEALWVSMLMMPIMGLTGLALGWLCDTALESDPLPILLAGTGILAVVGLPAFAVTTSFPESALVAIVSFSLVYGVAAGAAIVPLYLFITELFPAEYRVLGFGMTFNMAMSYIGGTASLVAEELDTASHVAPGAYVSCLGLVSFIFALAARHFRAKGKLPRYPLGVSDDNPAKAHVSVEV